MRFFTFIFSHFLYIVSNKKKKPQYIVVYGALTGNRTQS